jgi:exo-beta-1,3-glucanase (GH17 family)/cellulose synthase/poly-beta-1,6-N-acetylglucosamine synthase-like glycosyltransferase
MKRAAVLSARLFVALLIVVGVAAAQIALWGYSVQSQTPIEASAVRIAGYAYSPYGRDESPLSQTFPSEEAIHRDLDLLGRTASRIRTYGSTENPTVALQSGALKLSLTAGIWLDADTDSNVREIEAGLSDARQYRHVERLIVGNEALLRGDLTPSEMIDYLKIVKAGTRKPISTAEPWHVWLKHPEVAEYVDFITIHLLPYHEGVPVEAAVEYAMSRYDEIQRTFPGKPVVIGEIGWPSRGPIIEGAVPSLENQARFIREFLAYTQTRPLDYFIMEAIDQPWKVEIEGWAGAYWGVFNAERVAKFALEGEVANDSQWQSKALFAALIAFVPGLLVVLALSGWSIFGRIWMAAMIQACVSVFVLGMSLPVDYYLSQRDLVGLSILIAATFLTAAVLLTHGFEFGEVLFKRQWARRFMPLPPHEPERQPFVSVHLACCNEPPEMVIATIDSLAALDYQNFEVLVIDNNTQDEALWKPIEAHMATLGARFRFFHLANWPGFKAGALNFGLQQTDPRAEVVGVVDADYVVDPKWLSTLIPHFDKPDVAVVQAPQAHRDWETHPFRRMCNWEFDGFFRIGMHHRNERNALIQHGTMTLVRRLALDEVGGWSEWCICEDTELGLRLIEKGYDTRYVDEILGRGLTPSDFAAIKSQRFRWAFGAMQIMKGHIRKMVGQSRLNLAQRYHFLTGWFAWFGDTLQLMFTFASLAWTVAMLLDPKAYSLPLALTVLPIIGFMAFKAALGPVLYRRTMNAPWVDILGASLLSVGLSHAIARGIFAGIIKRKGEFVRTPKGWKAKGRLAFLGPIREELGLLFALWLAMGSVLFMRGAEPDVLVWVAILALETIPYMAALGCQIAAYMPETKAVLPPSTQKALPGDSEEDNPEGHVAKA